MNSEKNNRAFNRGARPTAFGPFAARWKLAAGLLMILALVACGPGSAGNTVGAVKHVVGQVELEHNGTRTALKAGDTLPETGTIFTGADGLAIAVLKRGRAELEIQKNSEFHLKKLGEAESEVHLRKGNLWVRVNKLTPREKFHVHTPTAVAGVRGTKFYTFHIQDLEGRDIHGTCHCEGDVHYDTHDDNYESVHSGDYVVLTREGKTILMTPEEMSFMGPDGATAHRHSAIPDSPLGPQEQQLTPEQMREFMEIAEKKFAAL